MNRRVPALPAGAAVFLALLLSLPVNASAGAPPVPGSGTGLAPGQSRLLPRAMRGKEALKVLQQAQAAKGLGVAAGRNDIPPAQLGKLLEEDATVWMDATAQVFFADTPARQEAAAKQATQPAQAFSGDPLALNSRPGASRIIHLDFDGADVVGTAWNKSTSLPDAHYAGYSVDADPGFNDQEAAVIAETWQRVAQLYAPFDVNVTTAAPAGGEAAYVRNSAGDTSFGAHVVFTSEPSVSQAICGGSCAGIAYLGLFGKPGATGYSIAWAFTEGMSTDPGQLAHVAAHEVGHQLSLKHDGAGPNPYYWGHGDWSPVMGGAAGRPLVQFSRGEYPGANNTEDDFARMAATNLPLLADAEGEDPASARDLVAAAGYAQDGLVSTRSDVDFFRIDHSCTQSFTARVRGTGAGSPLDLQLQLINSSGIRVATADPPSSAAGGAMTGMDATLSVPDLGADTYYLRVDGVGRGTTSDGYTDYGSVGAYRVTASGCAAVSAPPPSAPGTGSLDSASTPGKPVPTRSTSPARPPSPRIGRAVPGARRGTVTARARWFAPVSSGGGAVSGYRVRAIRLNAHNRVVRRYWSAWRPAASHSWSMRLPKGRYRFQVVARNRAGTSSPSHYSNIVIAR